MNVITPRNRSGRLGLFVVAALLLLGVAVVAAQDAPRSPNEPGDATQAEGANTLAAEEMVGRSPNEAADASALQGDDGANSLAPEEMAGQSPNDVDLDGALAPGAQNTLPVEEMVGRSPNGDDTDQAEAAAPDAPQAPDAEAVAGGALVFITVANVSGANADTACPAGYHLANLYELVDPTNLTYANIPVAKTRTDQGSGPVAGWWGWVRTGNDGSVANTAGTANCANWTSSTAGQYGTIVKLADNWTTAGVAISPWQAQTWSCGGIAPVWCVAD